MIEEVVDQQYYWKEFHQHGVDHWHRYPWDLGAPYEPYLKCVGCLYLLESTR